MYEIDRSVRLLDWSLISENTYKYKSARKFQKYIVKSKKRLSLGWIAERKSWKYYARKDKSVRLLEARTFTDRRLLFRAQVSCSARDCSATLSFVSVLRTSDIGRKWNLWSVLSRCCSEARQRKLKEENLGYTKGWWAKKYFFLRPLPLKSTQQHYLGFPCTLQKYKTSILWHDIVWRVRSTQAGKQVNVRTAQVPNQSTNAWPLATTKQIQKKNPYSPSRNQAHTAHTSVSRAENQQSIAVKIKI